MPSAKILRTKSRKWSLTSLKKMKNAKSGVIVDYCGITVEKDTALRAELRKAGVDYKVIKNTYIHKAADIAGLEGLDPYLEGMTAFAISDEDPLAPAKILCKFADDNDNFKIKVGMMDGASCMNPKSGACKDSVEGSPYRKDPRKHPVLFVRSCLCTSGKDRQGRRSRSCRISHCA